MKHKHNIKFWIVREENNDLFSVIGKKTPIKEICRHKNPDGSFNHATYCWNKFESDNSVAQIETECFPDITRGNPNAVECELVPKYLITNENVSSHIHPHI